MMIQRLYLVLVLVACAILVYANANDNDESNNNNANIIVTDISNKDGGTSTSTSTSSSTGIDLFQHDQHRMLARKYDASIVVEKKYNFHTYFNFTVASTKPLSDTVASIKIVSSYHDHDKYDHSETTDYAGYFYRDTSIYPYNDKYNGSYKTDFRWRERFGVYYEFHSPPNSIFQIKDFYDKRFNEMRVQVYEPDRYLFKIITLSNTNPAVMTGVSSTFAIDPIMVNLTLDSTEYYAGQSMNLTCGSDDGLGYYKIFQVPFSYKDDPTLFNNATVVKWEIKRQEATSFIPITWNKPGLYQMVLFSPYDQMVRGISDVFQVKQILRNNTNSTSVVLDKTSYTHQENMVISMKIEVGTPPLNSRGFVAFYRWNATIKDTCYYDANPYTGGLKFNGAYRLSTSGFIWNTTSTIMTTHATVSWLDAGWYKAVVYTGSSCDSFRVVTSKPFKLKPIAMRIDMPKRKYYRGESTTLTAISPYTYITDKSTVTFRDPYPFVVIDANVTRGISNRAQIFNYRLDTSVLAPGLYKIAIYNDRYRYGFDYLMTVRNSTFAVEANPMIVLTNKNEYNTDDEIIVTVTTQHKTLLSGDFRVKIYGSGINTPDRKETLAFGAVYGYGNSTSIQTSMPINWCVSCNTKKYMMEITAGYDITPIAKTEFMLK